MDGRRAGSDQIGEGARPRRLEPATAVLAGLLVTVPATLVAIAGVALLIPPFESDGDGCAPLRAGYVVAAACTLVAGGLVGSATAWALARRVRAAAIVLAVAVVVECVVVAMVFALPDPASPC